MPLFKVRYAHILVIIQLQPQSFTKTSVSSCRTICPGLNILLGPTSYLVLFAVLLVEVIIQTSKKSSIYISLIRSQLTYCSQVWRPHLLKHIMSLERVQRRATKFILNDFSLDYKSRLVVLQILPLMMQLEVNDIMLLMILSRSLYPLFVLDPAALQLI